METWDVAVLGAGIIGSTAACHLAQGGLRVAVVDGGGPSGGTSAASQSLLNPQNRLPGPEAELALLGHATYRRLYEEGGSALEFDQVGSVNLFSDPNHFGVTRERAAQLVASGVPVEVLDAAGVRDLAPWLGPRAVGGLYCPTGATIYAPGACRVWLDRARAAGATFFPFTRVTGLRLAHGRVSAVETDRGPLPCGQVVIAAGLEAGQMAGMVHVPLEIQPNRGHVVVTEPVPPLNGPICMETNLPGGEPFEADAMGEEERRFRVHLVLSQGPRGNLLLGRSAEMGRRDRRETLATVRTIVSRTARWVPTVGGLRLLRVFTGVRPESADGQPVVGPVPGPDGVWLAAGYGDKGVAMAYTARLLAEEILTGESQPLLATYRYGRPSLRAASA